MGFAFQTSEQNRARRPGRVAFACVPVLVFAYLVYVRTRDISTTFWLAGDQILY